jgi:hypothetical protein
MGTSGFKGDISAPIREFVKHNPGGTPRVLKVTPVDAMVWHSAAGLGESTPNSLKNRVVPYLVKGPCDGRSSTDAELRYYPMATGNPFRMSVMSPLRKRASLTQTPIIWCQHA